MEHWRPIKGFSGYQISSLGRVQSFKRGDLLGTVLKPNILKQSGRAMVTLYIDGKPHWRLVARLVCRAFNGEPPTKRHQAAHLDGNRTNDIPSNLEWKTPLQNVADRERHGRTVKGEKHHAAKLTADQVIQIRQRHKEMRDAGKSYGSVAALTAEYSLGEGTITDIVSRRKWKHI
jgi:hypothetical protein